MRHRTYGTILLGAVLSALACVYVFASAETSTTQTSRNHDRGKILLVQLEDEIINPVTSRFLCEAMDKAEELDVPLIIELDTPGGLLQSTREIVKRQLTAKIPVIVFVAPHGSRAASAGVFITLAAHIAAMAPGTNIGAAHVVDLAGKWPVRDSALDPTSTDTLLRKPRMPLDAQEVMSEKVMNDTLAWVEAIAKMRGRNAAWARDAVEKSVSVTAAQAAELGVVDLIANDLDDLLTKLDGRQIAVDSRTVTLQTKAAIVQTLHFSASQRILNILANPNIALLLLMFGLVLLGYELTHPGMWIPGITGLICLLLAALALKMLPTNYAALALILLGITLLLAEIKFTSYGLLTLGGVVCLFFGALALFDQPKPFFGVTMTYLIPIVATVTLLLMLLVFLVTRAQLHRPQFGLESFIGKTAKVVRPLEPAGKVFFNGTYWDAELKSGQGTTASHVRIVAVEGMKLIVEPIEADEKENPSSSHT
ncbi:MAG: NfeD family protein [Candidatus Sumerlaeaceae bacterium]